VTGWTVELRPAARKYRELDEGPKRDAAELLADLEEDPTLVPAIELRANPGTWRVRFHHDRYRMIYRVARAQKRIIVTRIHPRPTAYEGMRR
jgi:mRNA-degrading endonuclease RelE of RelBE toxin-antitoxin system